MEAATDAGMTQVEEQVDVGTFAAAAPTFDQEVAPPTPPKKQMLETDAEVKRK